MWSDNKLGDLWDLARNRTTNHKRGACSTSINQRTKVIDQAVSLGRSGMWGKACRILQSSGIAPNNDTTWQLLKSKHSSCPTPVPSVVHTTPVSLEPDFNIIAILWSFPKDTAGGPSGLCVQHLLDVVSIPLHTPICSSLRLVINILIAGKAPTKVSHFLAGARLIALNKIKESCPPDIRPIAFSVPNAISVISVLASPTLVLSKMIEDQLFSTLLESSSHANRARLLSVAAPHSSSWPSVVPTPGLGLHLEFNEYKVVAGTGHSYPNLLLQVF
ncbi:hypothetical protein EMCRGX_G003420 [Ephydatia muelleri]